MDHKNRNGHSRRAKVYRHSFEDESVDGASRKKEQKHRHLQKSHRRRCAPGPKGGFLDFFAFGLSPFRLAEWQEHQRQQKSWQTRAEKSGPPAEMMFEQSAQRVTQCASYRHGGIKNG